MLGLHVMGHIAYMVSRLSSSGEDLLVSLML